MGDIMDGNCLNTIQYKWGADMNTRTIVLTIRMNEEEYMAAAEVADAAYLPVSTYYRKVIIEHAKQQKGEVVR